MKKVILCGAIALFGFLSANAQEVQFGAKAGVNLATLTGDNDGDVNGLTSFHVGAVAEFKISDKFSFQPELMYSAQGAKEEYKETYTILGTTYTDDVTAKIKLDYINIPLMAKFYVAEGFSLEAGPQVGFLLSAKSEFEFTETTDDGTTVSEISGSEEEDIKDGISGFEYGLNFGVGYKMDSGLNFGARYNLGLGNVNDMGDENVHNSVLQVSLGYMF